MLHPVPPSQPAPSVFGVKQPSSRRGSTASVTSEHRHHRYDEDAAVETPAVNSGIGTARQIQQLEDAGDYPTALRLRFGVLESLSAQRAEALKQQFAIGVPLPRAQLLEESLLEAGDEYIRRLNFYALLLINKRNFREANRLLQHASSFVASDPSQRPINIFNDDALLAAKPSGEGASSSLSSAAPPSSHVLQTAITHRRVLHRAAATIENNMGLCAFKAGRLHDAEIHFFASAAMEEQLGEDADNPAATLFNMAQVQSALGKKRASADCAEAAAEHLRTRLADKRLLLGQQDEVRQLLLHVLFLKGAAEKELRQYSQALQTYEEAVGVAQMDHSPMEGPAMVKYAHQLLTQCVAAAKREASAPSYPNTVTNVRARSASQRRRSGSMSSNANGTAASNGLVGAGLLGAVIRPYSARPLTSANSAKRGNSASSSTTTKGPVNANEEGANAKLAPYYRRERIVTNLTTPITSLAKARHEMQQQQEAAERRGRQPAAGGGSAASLIDEEYAAILGSAYLSTGSGGESFLPPLAAVQNSAKLAQRNDRNSELLPPAQAQAVQWAPENVVNSNSSQQQQQPPPLPRPSSISFVDASLIAKKSHTATTPSDAESPTPASEVQSANSTPSPTIPPGGAMGNNKPTIASSNSGNTILIPTRPTTAPKSRGPPAPNVRSAPPLYNGPQLRESPTPTDDEEEECEADGAEDNGPRRRRGQSPSDEPAVRIPPTSLGGRGRDGMGADDAINSGDVPASNYTTEDLLVAAAARLSGKPIMGLDASSQQNGAQLSSSTATVLSSSPGLKGIYGSLSAKNRNTFDHLANRPVGTNVSVPQPTYNDVNDVNASSNARVSPHKRNVAISPPRIGGGDSAVADKRHLSPNRQFPWTPSAASGTKTSPSAVLIGGSRTGRSRIGEKPAVPKMSHHSTGDSLSKASNAHEKGADPSPSPSKQSKTATERRPSAALLSASTATAPPQAKGGRRSSSVAGLEGYSSATILYGSHDSTTEDLLLRATECTAREIAAETLQAAGRGFAERRLLGARKALSDNIRERLREEVRHEEQRVAELRAAEIIREHDRQLEGRRHAFGTEATAAADALIKQRASAVAAAMSAGGDGAAEDSVAKGGLVGDDIITLFRASVVNIPTGPAVPKALESEEDDGPSEEQVEVEEEEECEESFIDDNGRRQTRSVRKTVLKSKPRRAKRASLGAQTMVTGDAVGDLIQRQREHALRMQRYQEEQHREIEREKQRRVEGLKVVCRVQAHLRAMLSVEKAVARHDRIRSDLLEAYADRRQKEIAIETLKRHEAEIAERRRSRLAAEEARRVKAARRLEFAALINAHARSVIAVKAVEEKAAQRALRCAVVVQAFAKSTVAQMLTQAYFAEDIELAYRQQTAAAVVIQSTYRGYAARMLKQHKMAEYMAIVYENKRHYAASKIQATFKMHFYGKPIKPQIEAHGKRMYALAEAEARRLRLRAVAPIIQRAYRCYLARRAANFLRNAILRRRREYLSLAMRDYAARQLQAFARIVAAKKLVRHQKAVMADILKFREQQRNRMIAEHTDKMLWRLASCLLQRVGRAYAQRRSLRNERIRRVAEWDKMQSAGQIQ